jgi:DNA-binding NarL/FixJ family response regulator
METKRLALFDDDVFFHQSFKLIIEDHQEIFLAGIFPSADNLISNITKSKPDIVMMDIDMPGMNGIDAVKLLRMHFAELPVIMLTQHEEDDKLINSICAGANGYLLKTSHPDKMYQRILEVIDGGSSLDPSIANKVLRLFAQSFSPEIHPETKPLTLREKEVLGLLVNGNPYKLIANELGISYDTVRMHIKNIYQKLDVSNVSGAVAVAVSRKLVFVK